MNRLLQDLRYAARMIRKSPGVSGMAIIALALGIAVTATMFSIVYGAMMRGLPWEGGDRVMALYRTRLSRDIQRMGTPVADYADWRQQQSSFDQLAAYYAGTVNVRWADRPERFDGAFITANTFAALGVRPVLGRAFNDEEAGPGGRQALIISYHLWQDRFAGSRNVLGYAVKVNGEQAEIVGVMPEGFRFPMTQDVWVPLRMDPIATPRSADQYLLVVLGKLREGVSLDQATAEFQGICARIAQDHPDTNEGVSVDIMPFTEMAVGTDGRRILLTMLAAVSLVLLIACANVANLLLARASVRMKEVGIRTAMGASRWTVVSQMVAESFALALVGGVAGAGLAWIGIAAFQRAIVSTHPPFFMVFKLDGPILLFILGLSLVSAVVAGAVPALKASAMDVSSILKDESRGSSSLRIGRLSRGLVVTEIAMSMGLLVAAGLMTKSVTTLKDFDFGFDDTQVFTARIGLFESEFPDIASRRRFYEDLGNRLATAPGITRASLGTILPGVGSGQGAFGVEGESYAEDRDVPQAYRGSVDPGYFRTVGSDVTLGRDFEISDGGDAQPVAIVNASFAKKYLPGGTPLGRRIRVGGRESTEPWLTVVGVVPDLWMQGAGDSPEATPEGFYVPIQQSDARFMSILARGPADPMALTSVVRDAVTSVSSDTPIYFVNTLADRIGQNTWIYNVFGTLFMIFGFVALFLGSIGLYGVMAFSVSRRTPEVGIRMALGARGDQVLALILRQGMIQIAVGTALGLGLAVVISRALREVLFQVSAEDPSVFALAALVLIATGLLASTLPAWRAARVDPLVALRTE